MTAKYAYAMTGQLPTPYWIISRTYYGRDIITIHAFYHKNARQRTTFTTIDKKVRHESVTFALLIESGAGNELHHSAHKTMKEVENRLRALKRVMGKV